VLNTVGTLATRRLERPTTLGPRQIAVIVATLLFSCVALQTAFLPAGVGIRELAAVYGALVGMR
jgi:hypothetical protein